jgi:hypothetical protein
MRYDKLPMFRVGFLVDNSIFSLKILRSAYGPLQSLYAGVIDHIGWQ